MNMSKMLMCMFMMYMSYHNLVHSAQMGFSNILVLHLLSHIWETLRKYKFNEYVVI